MSDPEFRPVPTDMDHLRRLLAEVRSNRMVRTTRVVERLREAQSRLACAEPGRRLDPCSCWHGFQQAIEIVEESP